MRFYRAPYDLKGVHTMKKITRTVSVITGVAVKADFVNRCFVEEPFTVYDKSDIPENAQNVKEENRLYVISVEDFMKHARIAKDGEQECQ